MVKNLFNSKEAKTLWNKAEDGIKRRMFLSDMYNNVPKELDDVIVDIFELHSFDCDSKLKKKVLKWLNTEA